MNFILVYFRDYYEKELYGYIVYWWELGGEDIVFNICLLIEYKDSFEVRELSKGFFLCGDISRFYIVLGLWRI